MSKQIAEPTIGAIVVFEGDGFLWRVLSTLLGWFYPEYNRFKPKPWHVGFISRFTYKGWLVAEATGKGVEENFLSDYDPKYYKLYEWLPSPPTPSEVDKFMSWRHGCKYDKWAYLWVTIACLAQKICGVNIGRWQNNAYMCWELVEEFVSCMGKPFCKYNRTITIVDIMEELNGSR
jgi:hypothetical protein